MSDTQHDEHTNHQPATPVRPAKLNLALLALFDEMSDDVLARFPLGRPNSAEHLLAYDAMNGAIGAVEAVLTALPADLAFRTLVLSYVQRGWELTGGDPGHDETVKRAITRARADYKPETPEQRRRGAGDDEQPERPALGKGKKATK